MKRTRGSIPAGETGAIQGDYKGSRPFTQMPTKGGRNATTDEARRGAGQVAPRPKNSKEALLGASAHTAGMTASMARVTDSPNGDSALRLPVQSPKANIGNRTIGQPDPHSFNPGGPGVRISPQTKTPVTRHPLATQKPKRKGLGSAFFGEY